MKRTLSIVSIAALAALTPALPTVAEDFHEGEFNLGVNQTDSDTLSSKFLEYRDIPSGAVAPYFRFLGQKGSFRYDFSGGSVQQKDQRYRLRLGNETLRVEGVYDKIPHRFGNGGRTLLEETQEGVWQLSDTFQNTFQTTLAGVPRPSINFAFLNNLVSPSVVAANTVDLRLERERGNLAVRLTPDKPVDIRVSYFRERRVGDRAASGTAFGFSNVVELPETLHYLTQDVGADAQYEGTWGVVRAGLHFNWFNNRIETFSWDNPFRVSDATDASAYTAPGAGSINGPSRAVMALPPDNQAWVGTVGGTFKVHSPSRTRLAVDASYGDWTQNKTPFIAYTTNRAITPTSIPSAPFVATDPANLPARALDGKFKRTSLAASLSSKPVDKVTVNLRYRVYDTTNDTGRIAFPGYVRFDSVWEDIARISVPYDYRNQRFDGTVGYDFGPVGVEGGYRHTKFDRSFRETEHTSENALVAAANLRQGGWFLLRGSFETGSRDYKGLEIELSEEASFQEVGVPANLLAVPAEAHNAALQSVYDSFGCGARPCNIRFDQAKKDFDRFGATVQLTPGSGNASLSVAYFRTKDDYSETRYGLTKAQYDTVSVDADWSPVSRASLYAFYSYEKIVDAQRGRQSGATVSSNPLDDWTSDVKDKVSSIGGGAKLTLKPDKWYFDLFGRYQKVNGNNDVFAAPGGAPANARIAFGGVQDVPLYDDTKLLTLNAELKYDLTKAWAFALGGWFEDYEIRDANSAGLLNYVPGSFFLAANDGDYQATVGYVRLTYRW